MANYVSSYTGSQIDTRLDETILSGTASGVDTITTTISGMTYITGTKISLTTAGTNTVSAPTLNVNGLGIKTIKKLRRDSSKVDLVAGEIPSVALLEYDGTDFVLLNKVEDSIDDKFEKIETSRKRPNLIPDIYALAETTDNSSTFGCSVAVNVGKQKYGEGCIEATLTSTNGKFRYDLTDYVDTSKYYLVLGTVQNEDASTGGRLYVDAVGGSGAMYATNSASTSYVDQGLVLTPSDLSGLTELRVGLDITGVSTEKGRIDGFAIYEITPYEASLQVSDLISKLVFMTSKGIESFDNVVTLPDSDNMVDGRCDVVIEGLSLENSVSNGDFSNGTTGWSSISVASFTVSNNIASFTASATSGRIYQSFNHNTVGDKIFVYGKVKSSSTDVSFRYYDGATFLYNTSHSGDSTYEEFYDIVTNNSTVDSEIQIRDNTSSGWAQIDIDGNTGVFAINMTALGITHLSESQMLELVRAGYFESLQGTEGVEVDSKGKNLFDPEDVYVFTKSNATAYKLSSGLYIESNSAGTFRLIYKDYQLKPNTNYTMSRDLNIISGCTQTNDALIRITNTSATVLYGDITKAEDSTTFTTPSDGVVRIYFYVTYTVSSSGQVEFNNIQLELGSSATTYEPHKNSKASMPVGLALYSVPNGVRSSFNFNTGVEDKRVEKIVLTGSDLDNYNTGLTNIDLVELSNSFLTDAKDRSDWDNTYRGSVIVGSYTEQTVSDSTSSVGTFFLSDTKPIKFCVAKGKYIDTADMQANFFIDYPNAVNVLYELATYEQIQHKPQVLNAYPDGSIFKSEEITETLFYDSGLTVKSGLTPSSAVKVVKIDGVTGEETPIALSDVTVGSPTTISGASDSEIYRYTYRHSGSATGGKILYRYCLNDKDQKDGNSDSLKDLHEVTKKLSDRVSKLPMTGGYTLEKTIASGEITIDSYAQYHIVDTESDGATDDLDTINGGEYDGQLLIIRPVATGRTVVAKDGTGNLLLAGDFSMDSSQDVLTLVYVVSDGNWREVARSNNA